MTSRKSIPTRNFPARDRKRPGGYERSATTQTVWRRLPGAIPVPGEKVLFVADPGP